MAETGRWLVAPAVSRSLAGHGRDSAELNHDLVIDAVKRLALPRRAIDVDGTVVRTGATVGWAFRGFNPHHRKDPATTRCWPTWPRPGTSCG